eukprot:1352212-Ditylum_brightwellii.AAC.1
MGKLMRAAIVEFGDGCHRLLILPHVCLMGNVMRALIVELGAGYHIMFILLGLQDIKKAMRVAMKE